MLVHLLCTIATLSWCLAHAQAYYGGKHSQVIHQINRRGPYAGIVAATPYELAALLRDEGEFVPDHFLPHLDTGGRRYHVGKIHNHKVIVVLMGLGMLNAGSTTQQLLDLFRIHSVIHYGIAGSADAALNIADVSIASTWIHTGLWYWQRFRQGPNNPLPLEGGGDYTRKLGYLEFSDYNVPLEENSDNQLSHIYFQAEEVYYVDGTPEVSQPKFVTHVSKKLYSLASQLQDVKLNSCLNSTTCLSSKPKVLLGLTGGTSNIFVDNAAYRSLLNQKLNVSTIDMESAAVALRCEALRTPFIIIRSVSDLAGGSSRSNEAAEFAILAAENAVAVTIELIKRL